MKTFHIVNVGVSLLTNFIKEGKVENRVVSDNEFWRQKLDDRKFLQELYEFLKANPRKNSAELNSLLRIVDKEKNSENGVYLVGTKTPINEICVRTLERFLKEIQFTIYSPKEISAYFWEAEKFSEEYAKEEFLKDISSLIDRLIYVASKKKKDGYNVVFNPTGGLKAHVIACAIAGFLTNCPVYYIHEEFNDVVKLPPSFYLPKGKEFELLELLKDKKPKSGYDYQKLENNYSDEIERLELYGLFEREKDDAGKYFRVRITNRGHLFLELRKEV